MVLGTSLFILFVCSLFKIFLGFLRQEETKPKEPFESCSLLAPPAPRNDYFKPVPKLKKMMMTQDQGTALQKKFFHRKGNQGKDQIILEDGIPASGVRHVGPDEINLPRRSHVRAEAPVEKEVKEVPRERKQQLLEAGETRGFRAWWKVFWEIIRFCLVCKMGCIVALFCGNLFGQHCYVK